MKPVVLSLELINDLGEPFRTSPGLVALPDPPLEKWLNGREFLFRQAQGFQVVEIL